MNIVQLKKKTNVTESLAKRFHQQSLTDIRFIINMSIFTLRIIQ